MRAAQTGLQYSYYLNGATGRLAGTGKGIGGAELVAQTSGGQRATDPATRSVDPAKSGQERRA